MRRPFAQIDVFTDVPYSGNPVAVVLDGAGLDTEEMQRFANWTNLSETTFVLPPRTPTPTTGSASSPLRNCRSPVTRPRHLPRLARRAATGHHRPTVHRRPGPIRRAPDGLAFAAPPLLRTGPVEAPCVDHRRGAPHRPRRDPRAQWVDNGPGWVAVLLATADAVLSLTPGPIGDFDSASAARPARCRGGVRGPRLHPQRRHDGRGPGHRQPQRLPRPMAPPHQSRHGPLRAQQGTALGRPGRVHITQDPDRTVWVGGGTVTCVSGEVEL